MARKITEQRLADQARGIRKNEWLTTVEVEEIKRRVLQEETDGDTKSRTRIE